MSALWVILTITLPWLGALVVWGLGGNRPRAQHLVASGFSLVAAAAAFLMLGVTSD